MRTYLYKKIARALKYSILNGSYQPRQQLPSVRLIAKQENHNPATVHHALKDLAQQGLIHTRRTKGYFVLDDPLKIAALRHQECMKLTRDFLGGLYAFGYSDKEICMLMQEHYKAI